MCIYICDFTGSKRLTLSRLPHIRGLSSEHRPQTLNSHHIEVPQIEDTSVRMEDSALLHKVSSEVVGSELELTSRCVRQSLVLHSQWLYVACVHLWVTLL